MPTIHLTTFIEAPLERVFDLSRSIDLHRQSMGKYREEAVAGTCSGLAEKDDSVTWKARHLFKTRYLRSRITELKKYELFIDEQTKGDFKSMRHEHHFKPCENGTIMIDLFHFQPPYGRVGHWFTRIYLTRYIRNLLRERNLFIKEFAEGDKWKMIMSKQ